MFVPFAGCSVYKVPPHRKTQRSVWISDSFRALLRDEYYCCSLAWVIRSIGSRGLVHECCVKVKHLNMALSEECWNRRYDCSLMYVYKSSELCSLSFIQSWIGIQSLILLKRHYVTCLLWERIRLDIFKQIIFWPTYLTWHDLQTIAKTSFWSGSQTSSQIGDYALKAPLARTFCPMLIYRPL